MLSKAPKRAIITVPGKLFDVQEYQIGNGGFSLIFTLSNYARR